MNNLKKVDNEIYEVINNELNRQRTKLELIASENFVSQAVLEAQGSILTNKYAEGYPGHRYYGGCEYVDIAEELARERAKKLFNAEYVNVQPHSGSQANMAVYYTVMKPGDTMLGMDLSHGGHLTHGSPVNFSGIFYNVVPYGVKKEDHRIDFDQVRKLAKENKPKVIMVGASAYPRIIDFTKSREIADEVGAYMIVDMAHIAGLVCAGLHPSPVGIADFITTTTHKTLRGPRGGMILSTEKFAHDLDMLTFPGIQGGPLMHVISAKAVAFKEALSDDFKEYQTQVVKNAKALAEELLKRGYTLVSGGTDNHLLLVNVLDSKGISGKKAEKRLDKAGITVNKNTIPFDVKSPFVTSGIRIGTPALTTRGMKEDQMRIVAALIDKVLSDGKDKEIREKVKEEVNELCSQFPLYENM